jgi:hypothetical protein
LDVAATGAIAIRWLQTLLIMGANLLWLRSHRVLTHSTKIVTASRLVSSGIQFNWS